MPAAGGAEWSAQKRTPEDEPVGSREIPQQENMHDTALQHARSEGGRSTWVSRLIDRREYTRSTARTQTPSNVEVRVLGTLGWSMRGVWSRILGSMFLLLLLVVPACTAVASKKKVPRREAGVASWFRSRHPLSAAHRTLPIGSLVKVWMRNGRSVVVTVAGRGPFVKGRIIDLSSDAFKKLASLGTGLIQVNLERVR